MKQRSFAQWKLLDDISKWRRRWRPAFAKLEKGTCNLRRRERCGRFFLDLEVNRAMSGQLAVEFHRNILLACYAQAPGLEIFNLRDSNVRTEHYVLQLFDDFEITEPLEDDYIN